MARHSDLTRQLVQMSRDVTVGLLASVWPGKSEDDVAHWLSKHPRPGLVVGGTLSALLALSIAFAQFGVFGLLVFLLVVIIAVN